MTVEPSTMDEAQGASGDAEASDIAYGKYTYTDAASGEIWAVLIMGNGTCVMQCSDKDGNTVEEHACMGFRTNSDGTFTNFAWDSNGKTTTSQIFLHSATAKKACAHGKLSTLLTSLLSLTPADPLVSTDSRN